MPFILSVILASMLFLAPVPAAAADLWPYRDQLRTETRFWKDIFTKYDDNSVVLHDPEDLSLVYKTITFSPAENERMREQRLTGAKYEVENTLRRLADNMAAGRELTAQEKQLRQLFGPSAEPQHVKLCASRIRAQRGIANRFYQGLQNSTAYMPAIKKIFRDKGLPESLAYLPHVESSFNLTARSKVGAAGMWQFMKPTAKTFSLKMNSIIDERYDPLIASEAAASLLKMNYDELGDWGLALTAYNYGLGGMSEAAQRCSGNYLAVRKRYCSPRFQFASKNFYPEFLAATEVMENPGACFAGYVSSSRHRIVQHRLKTPATLPAFAKTWGIELSRLKELNPGYSKKAWNGQLTIPAGYSINIPAGSGTAAQDSESGAAAEKIAKKDPPKQSLNGANQLTSSVTAPAAERAPLQKNPQQSAGSKQNGTKATPSGDLSVDALRRELEPVLAVKNKSIKVFGDETLGHFAQWLKVSPQALCAMNRIAPKHNLQQQQQKLVLDFSHTSEAAFTQTRLNYHMEAIESMLRRHNLEQLIQYRMSASDSLQHLAQEQFKIPASLIVYFNPGQNLNSLGPGTVIRIPVSREAAMHIL